MAKGRRENSDGFFLLFDLLFLGRELGGKSPQKNTQKMRGVLTKAKLTQK